MKYLSAALLTALVAAAAGCSADRELPDLPDNTAGNTTSGNPEILVLTVGTPTDESTQTRVAYDDENLKLTWQAGDQLTVAGFDADGAYKGYRTDFTYKGEDNQTSGPFEGTAVSDATAYIIYYPNTVQVDERTGDASLSMEGQTYDPTTPTASLKNYMLLKSADKISPDANFTLEMASSIMKFDLSNIPAEVGKLTKLVWTTESSSTGGQTLMLDFPADAVTFSAGNTSLTAYLGFIPSNDEMTKFTVMLIGEKIYRQEMAMAKTYTAGSRYTATMAGAWTECDQMKMTVKVADDANGLGFNIPFPTTGNVPATTVVDWGDGSLSVIPQGTEAAKDDAFNHTYPQADTYTITIASWKAATETQILRMGFYRNRAENSNVEKLISVDTPLLNMNVTDLSELFSFCRNLATISQGLFDKNTAAMNFEGCFVGCTTVSAIPQGLFDKNTAATKFQNCFAGCATVSAIPQGLFDKNTAATNFASCFGYCTNLTTIPEGLFSKNIAATNFDSCFNYCKKLKLNKKIFSTDDDHDRFKDKRMTFYGCFQDAGCEATDPGEAPELWKYEKGGVKWTTADCFKNTSFTNKNPDPDGYTSEVASAWGTPKSYQQ